MADASGQLSAWIALFLGLYMLAAAVGELSRPGSWAAMAQEFGERPGLRFLAGAFTLALGAALYLAVPWRAGDALAIAINVVGGVAAAKGLLMLAAGDRFAALGTSLMTRGAAVWAGLAALLGALAVFAALSRLQLA